MSYTIHYRDYKINTRDSGTYSARAEDWLDFFISYALAHVPAKRDLGADVTDSQLQFKLHYFLSSKGTINKRRSCW